jgi:hypothetical protein
MKDNEKLLFFNDCNFQVAVLCNHCKTPAKNFGDKQEEKKKQLQEMEKVRMGSFPTPYPSRINDVGRF